MKYLPIDPEWLTPEIIARFHSKTSLVGECLEFTGKLTRDGYGQFHIKRPLGTRYAHRVAWVLRHGRDVPELLTVDHLCRNRSCCNPDHLEAVSFTVNFLRGNHWAAVTHRTEVCPRGHDLSLPNAWKYDTRRAKRRCRQCAYLATAEWKRRRNDLRADHGPALKDLLEHLADTRPPKDGTD